MQSRLLWIVALLAVTACEGQNVKETLGLTRTAPDEFVVVSRPPLSVPPDFQLAPPRPGAQGPQHSTEETAKSALYGTDKTSDTTKNTALPDLSDDEGSGFSTELGASKSSVLGDPNSEFTIDGVSVGSSDAGKSSMSSKVDTAVMPVTESDAGSAADSHFLSVTGADKSDPNIRDKLGGDVAKPNPKKKKATSLYEEMVGVESDEPVVDAKKESQRLRDNKDAGKPVTEGDTPNEETKKKSVLDSIW